MTVHYNKDDHRKYFPDAETCITACGRVAFVHSPSMVSKDLGKVTCKSCKNAIKIAAKRYLRGKK